jgi:hypothetical protein
MGDDEVGLLAEFDRALCTHLRLLRTTPAILGTALMGKTTSPLRPNAEGSVWISRILELARVSHIGPLMDDVWIVRIETGPRPVILHDRTNQHHKQKSRSFSEAHVDL